ncbi:ARC6/PARC6 family protein [Synechococcus sp. BIOS-E4-1]|uniref:ARC6/PARC6 family protein n=1 Tax=Synechococcus sp. BIOS-E4-1 TaxID=1400864 RepID=UPI002106B957|nr:ARC6/PARC6 family protein [Synechococcus sp. BIOS-E4-1]
MAAMLVDLPIDHFRLLGVSPTAEPEAVLRTLQLRLDRCPDQGFTHEALNQRAELLRLSADLLTDPERRGQYEATLLELGQVHPGDTTGLELSSNLEVAGLMLLWEAHAPHEAFQLARQALQPPQAPALGSGRESDLALLAALAARDAAEQDQEKRRYESAANLLQEGMQLLQRMGKLPEQRQVLETDLSRLRPFRILDLLSRDLAEQSARHEGLMMLETFISDRGGLEGSALEGLETAELPAGMDQGSFELFFQQIRRFLTVQEQVDLFRRLKEAGSADASFLVVMALAAAGFSQRKPERVQDARTRLQELTLDGLDTQPLLGCLDLLLGDVDRAERHFASSADPALKTWLSEHPGDTLAALCDYCRTWLGRDVLPGYRDVDAEAIDLEAWFADRDVQAYVERLERQEQPGDWSLENLSPLTVDPDGTLPLPLLDPDAPADDKQDKDDAPGGGFVWPAMPRPSLPSVPQLQWPQLPQPSRSTWIGTGVFLAVVLVIGVFSVVGLRREAEQPQLAGETSMDAPVDQSAPDAQQQGSVEDAADESTANAVPALTEQPQPAPVSTADSAADSVLRSERPSDAQLEALLQAWLDRKASVLGGEGTADEQLQPIARAGLINQVRQQRSADQSAGLTQKVEASIDFMRVISRTPQRIELRADVDYSDQTLNAAGTVVNSTAPKSLKVTYILGRDEDGWRLQAYAPV